MPFWKFIIPFIFVLLSRVILFFRFLANDATIQHGKDLAMQRVVRLAGFPALFAKIGPLVGLPQASL